MQQAATLRNSNKRLKIINKEVTISRTSSGPLGGIGRLILVADPLSFILGAWTFFFSSNEFSELPVLPLPLLSPGLCHCTDTFSSRPWEYAFGFPSLGVHLLSSYLVKYVSIRLWKWLLADRSDAETHTLHGWNSQSQLGHSLEVALLPSNYSPSHFP